MPKLSVVIPTKNRAALLAQTIDRIESQTVSRDTYEVIVIDNDSSDDTRTVLEQKSAIYRNLRTGFQEKPGAAATRNAGLRIANGEIILFIDDDIQAEDGLIEAHLSSHRADPNVSVIGAVTMPWGPTPDPFLRYLRDHRILSPYTPSNGPIDFSYYHTGNVSTPAHLLMHVSGFNENFRIYGMEDIELGYRLQKAGSRMLFAPDARAVHHRFPGFDDFVRRSAEAGYSLGYFIRLHPELKERFVESNRFARRLKSIHSLYRWSMSALSPLLALLTHVERKRGTVPLTRLMDAHYTWSIRYHFFLGYRRYVKEQARQEIAAPIKPALRKDYQVKAKGEL